MESLEGHFLVASSHLGDPNFLKSVVLLIRHNEEGAFGVVLNRTADGMLRDLWEKVSDKECGEDQRVYVGGPVPGPLLAVHGLREAAEVEIVPGVYFAAQRENLEKLVEQTERPFRMFIGHSGWGRGQLEGELRQGAWLTLPATAELVFSDDLEMWKRATHRVGEEFWSKTLGIRRKPPDAALN